MSAIAEREDRTTECQTTQAPRVEVINRDKDYLSGWPRFPGTRLPVRHLMDYLMDNRTIDEFIDDYGGVTREQCVDVLRFLCQDQKLYTCGYRGRPDLDEGEGSDYLEDDPEKW